MPTLYVIVGLPGAGKTTLAQKMIADAAATGRKLARSNRDCLRDEVHPGCYQTAQTEEAVDVVQHASILALLLHGVSVVCDDTNLNPERNTVGTMQLIATAAGAAFEIIDLTGVPLEVCIAQDAQRPDRGHPPTQWNGAHFGAEGIRRMHRDYLANRKVDA